MNPIELTAEYILSVPLDSPEKVFSRDNFELELRKLRSKWHPDKSHLSNANGVFAHIQLLANKAREQIRENTWKGPSELIFKSDSQTFSFSYKKVHEFELGYFYISDHYVVYRIRDEFKDRYDNAIKRISSIKFKDGKLKEEFQKLMPKIVYKGYMDDYLILALEKPSGFVLLSDLIDFLPERKIPPKHVAWIVSSLYNICLFFHHEKIMHGAILPQTVFVHVDLHAVMVLGGWWYAHSANEKLIALPSDAVKFFPSKQLTERRANIQFDKILTNKLALIALGDKSGSGSALLSSGIPEPMLTWLRTPPGSVEYDDYINWYSALERSFGKRKYTKFEHDISSIY